MDNEYKYESSYEKGQREENERWEALSEEEKEEERKIVDAIRACNNGD